MPAADARIRLWCYAADMAAKNKPTSRAPRTPSDITQMLVMHMEATVRHRELLQEGRDLLAAGKVREARKQLQRAEELHQKITALEEESQNHSSVAASRDDS